MKKAGWMGVVIMILATGLLWAAEDPYQNWSKDRLKAEIGKLKKQVEQLQQKVGGEMAGKSDNGYASAAPEGKDGGVLVDDFETDHPSFGGGWWEGCDQNKMGTTISPDPYTRLKGGSPKSSGWCAGMKGHLGPNEAPWPWATLTLGLGQTEGAGADLTPYKALRFYTQGDGKNHAVALIKASVKDYADYQADFTSPKSWTRVTIPFDKFAQPDWGAKVEKKFDDVKNLSFKPGLNDADYDFKIDDVEFLK